MLCHIGTGHFQDRMGVQSLKCCLLNILVVVVVNKVGATNDNDYSPEEVNFSYPSFFVNERTPINEFDYRSSSKGLNAELPSRSLRGGVDHMLRGRRDTLDHMWRGKKAGFDHLLRGKKEDQEDLVHFFRGRKNSDDEEMGHYFRGKKDGPEEMAHYFRGKKYSPEGMAHYLRGKKDSPEEMAHFFRGRKSEIDQVGGMLQSSQTHQGEMSHYLRGRRDVPDQTEHYFRGRRLDWNTQNLVKMNLRFENFDPLFRGRR